jgi:hypothetical protein
VLLMPPKKSELTLGAETCFEKAREVEATSGDKKKARKRRR